MQASNPDDDLIRLHHDWDATNVILGVDQEMRRQHRERDDPLDIDAPPPEPPSAEEIRLFDADFTGYRFVTRWSIGSGPHPIVATVC